MRERTSSINISKPVIIIFVISFLSGRLLPLESKVEHFPHLGSEVHVRSPFDRSFDLLALL